MPAITAIPTRAVQRETDRIREVFLSATARDLAKYREEVADALKKADAAVFLQEEWTGPASDVVTLSLNRLADSDAYLGMFGFRYGWIPGPSIDKSITELECDKALDVWGGTVPPPIFWFVPEPASEIAIEMANAADAVLAEEFPAAEAKREESRRRQRIFCERLRDIGRYVTPFDSLQALRENAITSIGKWNRDILKAAIESSRSAVAPIPLADLGEIDRDDQREAIEEALQAQQASGSPGMCLVVHGTEDSGQAAFLAALEQQIKWDIGGEVHAITPAHDQFDLSSLAQATLAEMARGQTFQTATMSEVASAIMERCRAAPVVMFLQPSDRLSGGIDGFRTGFWAPLLAAARALPATTSPRHPFVVVVALTFRLATPLPQGMIAEAPTESAHYDSLIVVPELGALRESQLASWLQQHKVSLADRKAIAARVTKDGVPRAVYDRLNSDGFWSRLQR